MKHLLLIVPFISIIYFPPLKSLAQANTTLSNLVSPTAINQHLIPNSNSIKDLGTSSRLLNVKFMFQSRHDLATGTRIIN